MSQTLLGRQPLNPPTSNYTCLFVYLIFQFVPWTWLSDFQNITKTCVYFFLIKRFAQSKIYSLGGTNLKCPQIFLRFFICRRLTTISRTCEVIHHLEIKLIVSNSVKGFSFKINHHHLQLIPKISHEPDQELLKRFIILPS